MFKKLWQYRYDAIFWTIMVLTLVLEWGSSNRVGLLPRFISWIPDFILIALIPVIILLWRQGRRIQSSPIFIPLAGLLVVSLLSLAVNQQDPLNYLAGFRVYFKYFIWMAFVLLAPFKGEIERLFKTTLLVLAAVQIPLVLVQRFVLGLHFDLASGTMVGTIRLALFLIVVYYLWFGHAVVNLRRPWLGLLGLVIIPTTILGEVKGIVFVFPFALLILLLHLHKRIGWGIPVVLSVATAAVILVSLPLFPKSKAAVVSGFLTDPLSMLDHQDQFSRMIIGDSEEEEVVLEMEPINEEDFKDPEKLLLLSKERPLGRVANLKFAFYNAGDLSNGGFYLGAGIGATHNSEFDRLDGALYRNFPTFRLHKLTLTMVLLEMGIPGLLFFAWFAFTWYRLCLKLIGTPEQAAVVTGYLGLGVLVTFGISVIYTNVFIFDGFLFVMTTALAHGVIADQKAVRPVV